MASFGHKGEARLTGAMANPYIDEVVNMVSSPDKEVGIDFRAEVHKGSTQKDIVCHLSTKSAQYGKDLMFI